MEYFHSKNFLHRDVKPENFVIGRGDNARVVYVIDYGLAKRFRDSTTKMHIPYRDSKRLTGTARYASLNTHMGIEQSRRDDLECLAYSLIYMIKGELPWQGVRAANKQDKYDKILDIKKGISVEHLCKDLPPEFASFMYYCRSLKFEDKPDYGQIKRWFVDVFTRNKYYRSFVYDWKKLNLDLDVMFDRTTSTNESNKAVNDGKPVGAKPPAIPRKPVEEEKKRKVSPAPIRRGFSKKPTLPPRSPLPLPFLTPKLGSVQRRSTLKHRFNMQFLKSKDKLTGNLRIPLASADLITRKGDETCLPQADVMIFVNKRIKEIREQFVHHTQPEDDGGIPDERDSEAEGMTPSCMMI